MFFSEKSQNQILNLPKEYGFVGKCWIFFLIKTSKTFSMLAFFFFFYAALLCVCQKIDFVLCFLVNGVLWYTGGGSEWENLGLSSIKSHF